jgi:hypothetical protein
MDYLAKLLFPHLSRSDRRRKLVNLLLAAGLIAAAITAALLLRASGM